MNCKIIFKCIKNPPPPPPFTIYTYFKYQIPWLQVLAEDEAELTETNLDILWVEEEIKQLKVYGYIT